MQHGLYAGWKFEGPSKGTLDGMGDEVAQLLFYLLYFRHDCDVIAGDDPRNRCRDWQLWGDGCGSETVQRGC